MTTHGANIGFPPKGASHSSEPFINKVSTALHWQVSPGSAKAQCAFDNSEWITSLAPGAVAHLRMLNYNGAYGAPYSGKHFVSFTGFGKVDFFWNNQKVADETSTSFDIPQESGQLRCTLTATDPLNPLRFKIWHKDNVGFLNGGISRHVLDQEAHNDCPRLMVPLGTNFIQPIYETARSYANINNSYTVVGNHTDPRYLMLDQAIHFLSELGTDVVWLNIPVNINDSLWKETVTLINNKLTGKKVVVEFGNEIWHKSSRFQCQSYLYDQAEKANWKVSLAEHANIAYSYAVKRMTQLMVAADHPQLEWAIGLNGGFGRHSKVVLNASHWVANEPATHSLDFFKRRIDLISPAIYIPSFTVEKKYLGRKVTSVDELYLHLDKSLNARLSAVQTNFNNAQSIIGDRNGNPIRMAIYEWGTGFIPDMKDPVHVDIMLQANLDPRVKPLYHKIMDFCLNNNVPYASHFNSRSGRGGARYGAWGLVLDPLLPIDNEPKGQAFQEWKDANQPITIDPVDLLVDPVDNSDIDDTPPPTDPDDIDPVVDDVSNIPVPPAPSDPVIDHIDSTPPPPLYLITDLDMVDAYQASVDRVQDILHDYDHGTVFSDEVIAVVAEERDVQDSIRKVFELFNYDTSTISNYKGL